MISKCALITSDIDFSCIFYFFFRFGIKRHIIKSQNLRVSQSSFFLSSISLILLFFLILFVVLIYFHKLKLNCVRQQISNKYFCISGHAGIVYSLVLMTLVDSNRVISASYDGSLRVCWFYLFNFGIRFTLSLINTTRFPTLYLFYLTFFLILLLPRFVSNIYMKKKHLYILIYCMVKKKKKSHEITLDTTNFIRNNLFFGYSMHRLMMMNNSPSAKFQGNIESLLI